MKIICRTCRRVYHDPGGDLGQMYCTNCGSRFLQRIRTSEDTSQDTAVGLVAGAALGGAVAGPLGLIIGAVLGGLLGSSRSEPKR